MEVIENTERKPENLFGYFTTHRFFVCLRGGVMTLSSKVMSTVYPDMGLIIIHPCLQSHTQVDYTILLEI